MEHHTSMITMNYKIVNTITLLLLLYMHHIHDQRPTRAESGTPTGMRQSGKKQRQGELTECGVKGPTQPRLTDRVRGRQARLRQKELDAEKKAKEKDMKQEKVDKDNRARERKAAKLWNFFVAEPTAVGSITPRRDG
jgi:hypothetical protein